MLYYKPCYRTMIGGFPDMWENTHQSFSPTSGARGVGMENEFGQVSLEVSTYFWMIYAHCSFLLSHSLLSVSHTLILSLLSCLSVLLTVSCSNAHSVLHFLISLSLLLACLLFICLVHSCVSLAFFFCYLICVLSRSLNCSHSCSV